MLVVAISGPAARLAMVEEDWPTCSISAVGIRGMSLNLQIESVRLCLALSRTRQTMVDLPDEEPQMEVMVEKKQVGAVELWVILIHMKIEEVLETMIRGFMLIAGKHREVFESHQEA
jgi:hypothetical protein